MDLPLDVGYVQGRMRMILEGAIKLYTLSFLSRKIYAGELHQNTQYQKEHRLNKHNRCWRSYY